MPFGTRLLNLLYKSDPPSRYSAQRIIFVCLKFLCDHAVCKVNNVLVDIETGILVMYLVAQALVELQ